MLPISIEARKGLSEPRPFVPKNRERPHVLIRREVNAARSSVGSHGYLRNRNRPSAGVLKNHRFEQQTEPRHFAEGQASGSQLQGRWADRDRAIARDRASRAIDSLIESRFEIASCQGMPTANYTFVRKQQGSAWLAPRGTPQVSAK
jgi:hypothetical protein